MARPKGVKEPTPRKPGAGRKPKLDYRALYDADPTGKATVTLHGVPLSDLAYAQEEADRLCFDSVQDWIRSLIKPAQT